MKVLHSFSRALIYIGSHLQSLFLLIVRVFWGYQFLIAGWGKLQNIAQTSEFFHTLGIAYPTFSAYATGIVETVCGALLIVGFASRFITLPLIIVMLTAFGTAHIDATRGIYENPLNFIQQAPFTFLLAALIVFIFGPGRFSIDYILKRVIFKNEYEI
jgi:putative oxidoreductase